MRRRTIKRRLFWTGVVLALLLVALAGIVARAVGVIPSTAQRRATGPRRGLPTTRERKAEMTRERPKRWTRITALAVAAGMALILAATAMAKPRWIDGRTVNSTIQSCSSVAIGQPLLIKGAIAQVGFFADPKALPKVGQTFYTRVFLGGVGEPCADQAASMELVLPVGVKLAITAKTPVRCLALTAKTSSRITAAQGCPQRAQRGSYGLLFPRTTRNDGLWALPAGEGVFVDVPLRSSRKLNGIASGLPSCGRREGQPPCPASRARDHLQVGVRMYDGNDNPWLVPTVGLHIR